MSLSSSERAERLIPWGLALITLTIWTPVMDPINLPKMSLLSLTTIVVLTLILMIRLPQDSILNLLLATFALFLCTAYIFSDQHYSSFWGAPGRQTGLVTYAGFVGLFFATSQVDRTGIIQRLYAALIVVGSLLMTYAAVQLAGRDFIKWDDMPFSRAVTTLGNPNFTSGFLGMSLAVMGVSTFTAKSTMRRVFAGLLAGGMTTVILLTNSIQGAAAGITAVVTVFGLRELSRNLRRAIAMLTSVAATGVLAIVSFLGRGPFYFLKQETFTYRLDFWRAGIKMMLTHPLTGVGLDRFGANWREYRDLAAIKVGNESLADAAHNVPIQLGATGGFPLLSAYLALQIFILVSVLKQFSNARPPNVEIAIAAAWLAYQLQSLVSIDQIGLSVWGWAIGGALLARRTRPPIKTTLVKRFDTNNTKRAFLVGLIGALAGVYISTQSVIIFRAKLVHPMVPARDGKIDVVAAAKQFVNERPKDPQQIASTARWLFDNNYQSAAAKYALKAIRLDSKQFSSYILAADVARLEGDCDGELQLLTRASRLDPLNTDLKQRMTDVEGRCSS